jgi:hypothetical protein
VRGWLPPTKEPPPSAACGAPGCVPSSAGYHPSLARAPAKQTKRLNVERKRTVNWNTNDGYFFGTAPFYLWRYNGAMEIVKFPETKLLAHKL